MLVWTLRSISIFLLALFTLSRVASASLSDQDRFSLRYHLKNLFNEVDLLIRNDKANQSDLRRQEKELSIFKVYERIPLKRDLEGLRKDLTESAKLKGLEVLDFRVLPPRESPGKSKTDSLPETIPKWIYSDNTSFQLKPDHLVETIEFQVKVRVQPSAVQKGLELDIVQKWTAAWLREQVRLAELAPQENSIQALPSTPRNIHWLVTGKAYRFLPIRYPSVVPRPPQELLPKWARKNSAEFSRQAPELWSLVQQTEALIPQARPLYKRRAEFLLNNARLAFYFKKTNGT